MCVFEQMYILVELLRLFALIFRTPFLQLVFFLLIVASPDQRWMNSATGYTYVHGSLQAVRT